MLYTSVPLNFSSANVSYGFGEADSMTAIWRFVEAASCASELLITSRSLVGPLLLFCMSASWLLGALLVDVVTLPCVTVARCNLTGW
jgi:hypothetical protein